MSSNGMVKASCHFGWPFDFEKRENSPCKHPLFNQYLTNGELDTTVSVLDVVCTPYQRHIGSTNIAIRAVAAQRPVPGSHFGWLGYVIRHFDLGGCRDVKDTAILHEAIENWPSRASSFEVSHKARQIREFHTLENFSACWTRRLKERWALL